MGMYDYRRYYKTFVTVTEDGEIRLGKYRDARNRYSWVIVGALQWMQPEYELDEEGNIFRTLWGKKRILYTSDQIRQAVDRAKKDEKASCMARHTSSRDRRTAAGGGLITRSRSCTNT